MEDRERVVLVYILLYIITNLVFVVLYHLEIYKKVKVIEMVFPQRFTSKLISRLRCFLDIPEVFWTSTDQILILHQFYIN